MTRKITASVLVLSMALTSLGAAPAQAGNREFNRLVVGALTLFIIGKAIEGNSKKRVTVSRSQQNPVTPLKKNRHRVDKRLPSECYFQMRTDRGTRGVYGKLCLNEIMRRADRLPQACADTIRVRYGRRAQVYGANCLREHGYRDTSNRY